MPLSIKHTQHLAQFKIHDELLRAAQIESVADSEARALLGVHSRYADDLQGIAFPYLSPIDNSRKGCRIRLDVQTSDNAKYLSEAHCRHLFFAPCDKSLLADTSAAVMIVEAEKSALAVASYAQREKKKMLCVAIGGCWGWRRSDGKEPLADGGTKPKSAPSPDFDLITLKNRVVVLLFDSNALSNQKVQAARDALAKELSVRGALLLIATVPGIGGVNGPDDLIAQHNDIALSKVLIEAKSYDASKHVALLLDMPDSVLDGKLGDLCSRYMLKNGKFPIAYAWPSLLAVASALALRTEKQRVNLYVALVGKVGSGKTQAIQAAQQLLNIEAPVLLELMAGSGEGLIRKCKDGAGNARLFSPDELGHLLEKSQIEHASFNYILNRAFYAKQFEVAMGKKENAVFNASLSILGGLVDKHFEDLFNHSTTGGLYDRFLFGACPGGFRFDYTPFEAQAAQCELSEVRVSAEVWEEKKRWRFENPDLTDRVIEIALRAATVCASFDNRKELRAKDLQAALQLAEYQQRIRRFLKPNEGESPEARIALKILAYLSRCNGDYVTKRKLLADTNAYRIGPSIVERALRVLYANEDIEMTNTRPVRIRKFPMNGDSDGEDQG